MSNSETVYHPPVQVPISEWLNNLVRRVAETTAWLNIALIAIILIQVVMRYGFNNGLVPLEELMWHFYATAFMFGIAYAVTQDSHIRVDIVHMNLSRKSQHIIEILGILLLMLPFTIILLDHSIGWAYDAYLVGESSSSPTGLTHRWIIKAVIPLTMVLMMIAGVARLIQEISLLLHHGKELEDDTPGRISMLRHLFQPTTIQRSNEEGSQP